MFQGILALVQSAKDDKFSRQLIKDCANEGDTLGEYALGELYSFGYGVKQNYAEAAQWYEKAATQGLCEAQFTLGRMYETGYGAPAYPDACLMDHKKSVYWYRLAASQGRSRTSHNASYNLGIMHYYGHGCPRSAVAAYVLCKFAINSLGIAQETCKEIADTLSTNELNQAEKLFHVMLEPSQFLLTLDAYLENVCPQTHTTPLDSEPPYDY